MICLLAQNSKTAKHKRSINVYRRLATDAVRDGDLANCTRDAVKIPRGTLLIFFPANNFWGGKSFIPILLTLHNLWKVDTDNISERPFFSHTICKLVKERYESNCWTIILRLHCSIYISTKYKLIIDHVDFFVNLIYTT